MISRHRSNTQAGFTIVETIIVLAIAGLILLIVFLALPALERNSANNSRRQDVQTILQAVSRYELDDSGNFPAACGSGSGGSPADDHACTASAGGGSNDYFLQYDKSRLNYYTGASGPDQITLIHQTPPSYLANAKPDLDQVYIYNYEVCSPDNSGTATTNAAGYNNAVALYSIETGGGGTAEECQQL